MRKIGPLGMKWLKIIHLVLVVFFLGGILSSSALNLNLNLANYQDVYVTYQGFVIISDHIVRYGGVGILLLSFIYGFFTTWGFFKHKWLTVKWFLFIPQTLIGIFIVDRLMTANVALLETMGARALSDPVFLHNHFLRLDVVIAQIVTTLFIIAISVIKPWRSKRKVQEIAAQ